MTHLSSKSWKNGAALDGAVRHHQCVLGNARGDVAQPINEIHRYLIRGSWYAHNGAGLLLFGIPQRPALRIRPNSTSALVTAFLCHYVIIVCVAGCDAGS